MGNLGDSTTPYIPPQPLGILGFFPLILGSSVEPLRLTGVTDVTFSALKSSVMLSLGAVQNQPGDIS